MQDVSSAGQDMRQDMRAGLDASRTMAITAGRCWEWESLQIPEGCRWGLNSHLTASSHWYPNSCEDYRAFIKAGSVNSVSPCQINTLQAQGLTLLDQAEVPGSGTSLERDADEVKVL